MRVQSTNDKLKVLVLPSWYPTERYPVGGIFIQQQARALAARPDVDLAVLFVDRTSVSAWLRGPKRILMSCEEDVPVYRLPMPRVRVIWPFLYAVWTVLGYAGLRRRKVRPDVVHAHVAVPAGLAGALIKLVWRTPLVLTEHTGPFSTLMRNRPAALATRLAMRRADRVVAVSAALRDQITSYPQLRRPIDVIHNLVNLHEFIVKSSTWRAEGPARLLFVGEMLTSIKGVDYLIGAVSVLRKRGIEVTLDLVGEGRNRREYETLSRRLRVADLCRFHGALPHERVAGMMPDFDLLVLSSLAETFGIVVVEALASGVPVVATRCGGPEEVVTPDLGVLVETANSAALADGILDVLSRPGDFPPAHLRQVVEARFGPASITARLVALYRQIDGRRD
jgi:glycosyltransferase involved in cell wall biosynthesis